MMLASNTYYLVPWQNPWTRKLAGRADRRGVRDDPVRPGPAERPQQ